MNEESLILPLISPQRVRKDLVVTKGHKERRDHKDKKEFRERVIQR